MLRDKRWTPWVNLLAVLFLLGAVACDSASEPDDDGNDTAVGVDTSDGVADAGEFDDSSAGEDTVLDAVPNDDTAEDVLCVCELDELLCTDDRCNAEGVCEHVPLTGEGDLTIGQPAPDFSLSDINGESATDGQQFTLHDVLPERVAVLTFHSAACVSCQEQSELARAFWTSIRDDDEVWFATVNAIDGDGSLSLFVDADAEGVEGEPPPSTWAVLQDDAEARVWERYCASNDKVYVIDHYGFVRYDRQFNFGDEMFLEELRHHIEMAKSAGPDQD